MIQWTAEAYREYGLQPSVNPIPVPWGSQDVASALDHAIVGQPDKEALVGRYARYSFRQYDEAINAAAAFMASLGVGSGDRIAASAPNHPEIVIAFFAAMRLGAIWVGINRKLARAEKRFLLANSEAKILLADDEVLAELGNCDEVLALDDVVSIEAASPDSTWHQMLVRHAGSPRPAVKIDPWAPASIAYTSGTTGFPKGVVHSQHNMVIVPAVPQSMADAQELASHRYGTSTPLTILNLMILGPVAAARAGATHVCMDRVDPVGVAEWIGKEQISVTSCAPTTVYDMLTRPEIRQDDLRSLVRLAVGGATVPERLPALYYERFGCLPRVAYGLTEAPTGVAASDENADPAAPPRPQGEIGPANPQLELQILDEEGQILQPEISGEICFRAIRVGPFAGLYQPSLGYWRNAAATAKLLHGGWVHTGDIGFKDQSGNLHVQDRRTDVIQRGGANIYPAEVERVLRLEPRVADCAVLGKPDARLGQIVVAFIQPTAGARGDATLRPALEEVCRENLARYKHPVEWHILEDLPRNPAGKIVKPRLSDLLAAAEDSS